MPFKKSTVDPLTRTLKGFFNSSDIEKLLNVSRPTAIKKLNNPELLTVGELRKLNRLGHVPIERLREGI